MARSCAGSNGSDGMRNTSASRIIPSGARRLTTPDALIEAGLAAPERRGELEAVAERYAIGLTPALAGLIDAPAMRPIRSRASSSPTLASLSAIRPRATIRSATTRGAPSRASCIAIRDRVLIKLVAVCAVYCRFCFRRETGRAGLGVAERAGIRRRARLCPGAIPRSGRSS